MVDDQRCDYGNDLLGNSIIYARDSSGLNQLKLDSIGFDQHKDDWKLQVFARHVEGQ